VRGASNGGLTVAAVITQRPDLFRAAVCAVPVIDVIRSPLFGDGKEWVPEYGSPDKVDEFKAMYDYSPYHHVKAGVRTLVLHHFVPGEIDRPRWHEAGDHFSGRLVVGADLDRIPLPR